MEDKTRHASPPASLLAILSLETYILDHLDLELSIAQLARKAGLNQSKLKTGFKLVHGQTIHQFIMKHRMEKAKRLLLETDKPIKEIASLVGYSERNFYGLFQKHQQCTPHQIRQTCNG